VKSKSRFSKERDEERALKERHSCLAKFQKDADIPMEVLAALPLASGILVKHTPRRPGPRRLLRSNRARAQHHKETSES
jgi:hypothetical protein